MTETALPASVLGSFPAVDEAKVDALLAAEIAASPLKFIVLDDDPTGVQTVHDIRVYTQWTEDAIAEGLSDSRRAFYILTNSRGMTPEETTRVHREIMSAAAAASRRTGVAYRFISRSDSTLRGHYPLETELLRQGMEASGLPVDGEILAPYFRDGGRFTIGNVHYVRQGDVLVPAAQTEFARDVSFGYTHSSLPEYIEEKTGGRYPAKDVACVPLEWLRAMDIDAVTDLLMGVKDFGKVCVNAVADCDLKVFCIALYRAMARGKNFIFRTAAGFVKCVAGVPDRPLLSRSEMIVRSDGSRGGVVVVGSHTEKTTAQLEALLKLDGVVPVAFRSGLVLEGDEAFDAEVARCVAEEEAILRQGKTAVCYTERALLRVPGDTKASALMRSVKISDGVQRLVGDLGVTPAFIVAKGGITSSDVGTKALRVRRAMVMGQIRPGIPVWQTGEESRFPNTPYVIFPGNVGEAQTLREAVEILMG